MKLSQNKAFHTFLKKKGITVKNGAVPIDKAEKIPTLYHQFGIEEAKKAGLPKKLQKYADEEVTVSLSDLERSGQTPEKYDVEIIESEKSYETGLWSGAFKGTVTNLWKWMMDECTENHGAGDFEEAIQDGIDSELSGQ
jgi:hypothetical protein